jgi:hypothetical protein
MVETGVWAPNKGSMDHLIMFKNASIAMAVANLDGKFVDCNVAFGKSLPEPSSSRPGS